MAAEITPDGAFPDLFGEFVDYKRNLGYVYPDSRLYLVRRLSRFLAGRATDERVLTRDAGAPVMGAGCFPCPTPVPATSLQTARSALPTLPVVEPLPLTGYEREFFGAPWADVDGNGCDTRNDVLVLWLTDQVRDPVVDCVVESGRLHDPYTGHVIDLRRGPATSSAVQTTMWSLSRTRGARAPTPGACSRRCG